MHLRRRTDPASETQAPNPYRVDLLAGARAGLRWAVNPVSIDGAASVAKVGFAIGGPGLFRQVEEMRKHPDGCRILRDRPDLGTQLADLDALGAMPDGSLGRAYHAFMSKPEAVPGYLLAGLMYRGGEWNALDWDDDMRFLFERMSHTHDLVHAVSGYGTHLASEAININFDIGIQYGHESWAPLAAVAFSGLTTALLWPTIGARRWHEHMMVAYKRGLGASRVRPFHCTYFEELLPRPLSAVRAEWGIPELDAPLDTTSWLGSPLGKAMANGYGAATPSVEGETKANILTLIDRLVKLGVPIALLVNLSEATITELLVMVDGGAEIDELLAVASADARVSNAA